MKPRDPRPFSFFFNFFVWEGVGGWRIFCTFRGSHLSDSCDWPKKGKTNRKKGRDLPLPLAGKTEYLVVVVVVVLAPP